MSGILGEDSEATEERVMALEHLVRSWKPELVTAVQSAVQQIYKAVCVDF